MVRLFFAILFWGISSIAFADKKEFIREYTYIAGENDSKTIAKENALKQIKSLLLEELGTYIESYVNYSASENNSITKDFFTREIKTISGGITETKIIEENWNGYEYYIKAQITADPEEVIRKINESLEIRKNSVAVDSLKMLLSLTTKEIESKDKELEKYRALISEQRDVVSSRAEEIKKMQDELTNMRLKLSEYEYSKKIIQSEVQKIENRIQSQSDVLLKNARRYMTWEELIRVCGKPSSQLYHRYASYGCFMAYFTDGLLVGVCHISAFDYYYKTAKDYKFNILKK